MMFDSLDFEQLNETDVREEVIAPLLRRLGYRSGTRANIVREQSLRYPRQFLGRKDPKRDPVLRGKADYVLEVDEAIRWVIEAKAPYSVIGADEIEQAWSYANHPEIRAVYFVLCNGLKLQIFQTNQGPSADSLLELDYSELNAKLDTLCNVLGPDAVIRDHSRQEIDVGQPLGNGLRSIARISNGRISYENNSASLRALNELQLSVLSGAVERDEDGHLVAFLRTQGPSRTIQELNERLGLSDFEMLSEDGAFSENVDHPTVFRYNDQLILPKGERLLDMAHWQMITLPQNVICDVTATAEGILKDRIFSGFFMNNVRFQGAGEVVLQGRFAINLA